MQTLTRRHTPMSFAEEYEQFVQKHLCPLLGITENSYAIKKVSGETGSSVISYAEDGLTFFAGTTSYFKLVCSSITQENFRLAKNVVDAFLTVSEFGYRRGSGKSKFYSDAHRESVYRKAVERGIHCWIVDHSKQEYVDEFFDILDTWSVKTYEGKSVTFGFIIQPHLPGRTQKKVDNGVEEHAVINTLGELTTREWLSFLKEDTSAVLTDCIHSVIELDEECNFVRYCTIVEGQNVPSCELDYQIPIRFTHIIKNFVTNKKVGVFLLGNGDIVLAKNQAVYFVKRNGRWLNLSYKAFRNALEEFLPVGDREDPVAKKKEKLLQEIFASVLDVSFSHAGGIVAIASDHNRTGNDHCESLSEVIGEYDDLMNNTVDFEFVYDGSERPNNKEKIRKIVKRKMIKNLTNGHTFFDLDRKLRGELIGLDGACILNEDGQIRAFGAIIKNDPGSTGGARKAAAEKLSRYGMAVKVSTDGYIEVFVNGTCKYAIK